MPQYYSRLSSTTENSEMSAPTWSQNEMLPCRMKRSKKRRLDDGAYELPRPKKYISEEKMASYLQGLRIGTHAPHHHRNFEGVIGNSHHGQQCERLQVNGGGVDEAFYSTNRPSSLLHLSPTLSPEIILSPPTPINNSVRTKPLSLSHWDVIIEDLSSEEDELSSPESENQPTIYLSPEARENMGKTHLLPPSIIDELRSKPCMELVPWVPKEKLMQDSLLRCSQMDSFDADSSQLAVERLNPSTISKQGGVGEELWDYDDNMEL